VAEIAVAAATPAPDINKMYKHNDFIDSVKMFLLVDSLTVRSDTGLAGKAGIALALFELSGEDPLLGDFAFDFFQESMAMLNDDYSYRGCLGVGMILRYLINEKLLDANFQELFGEKHDQIVKYVLSEIYVPSQIPDLLLYFHLSEDNTDLKELYINNLLQKATQLLCVDDEFYRKWHFITRYFPVIDTFHIEPQYIVPFIPNNRSRLIDMVDILFYSKMNDWATDKLMHTIVQSTVNYDEQNLNLAFSRLLVLQSYPGKLPPELFFFFY
jgi:hypothetical protein